MASLNLDALPGKIGVLLASNKRYIIRSVELKDAEGHSTSEVVVSFEHSLRHGSWERETHRLPIQTLREASVCNPFGDDYETPSSADLPGHSENTNHESDIAGHPQAAFQQSDAIARKMWEEAMRRWVDQWGPGGTV